MCLSMEVGGEKNGEGFGEGEAESLRKRLRAVVLFVLYLNRVLEFKCYLF